MEALSIRARAAVRWLGGRSAVLPVTARVLCARTVRESPLFFARELLRPSGSFMYSVRTTGVRVAIRHRGVDAATLAEVFYHRFYDPPPTVAGIIGEPSQILDLGANIGLFGAFAAARWPQSRISAYEPDPQNAALLERTVSANALAERWRLERAAAGTRDGEVRFAGGLDVDSHVLDTGAEDRPGMLTVPLRDVLAEVSAADLVKMDIEGGEWDILYDQRFANDPPRCIVLEYHPRHCPGARTQSSVLRALELAGLRTESIWHGDDGHGMLWAWRP